MSEIRFRNAAHRDFFLESMMKCKVNDCYHRAFFYVMGIAGETRQNINAMFDFKTDCIKPEGTHAGWQTSGTVKVCHLAFNLCSAANSPRISWRASRHGIQNIAGTYPRPRSRRSIHGN